MKTTTLLLIALAALSSCSPLADAGRKMNAANRALDRAQKRAERGEISPQELSAAAWRMDSSLAEFHRIGAPINSRSNGYIYAMPTHISSNVFIYTR